MYSRRLRIFNLLLNQFTHSLLTRNPFNLSPFNLSPVTLNRFIQ